MNVPLLKCFYVFIPSNRKREAAKELADKFMSQGNVRDARKHQQRCVDVSHEMALQLIKRCRAINVDCIVAPYEADAQLAYLNKIGLADYVLTEDSDLVLFGCGKILFKFDLFGNCDLVESDKLHLAMDVAKEKFTMDKFRLMCILSVRFFFAFEIGFFIYLKSTKFRVCRAAITLIHCLESV